MWISVSSHLWEFSWERCHLTLQKMFTANIRCTVSPNKGGLHLSVCLNICVILQKGRLGRLEEVQREFSSSRSGMLLLLGASGTHFMELMCTLKNTWVFPAETTVMNYGVILVLLINSLIRSADSKINGEIWLKQENKLHNFHSLLWGLSKRSPDSGWLFPTSEVHDLEAACYFTQHHKHHLAHLYPDHLLRSASLTLLSAS